MAESAVGYVGGVRRKAWDDDTETYTEYAADGVTVTFSRPYTVVELAEKAERLARVVEVGNDQTLRQQLRDGIAALQADNDGLDTLAGIANATINGNPAAYIKPLGARLRRTNRGLIALARIIGGSLGSTDD